LPQLSQWVSGAVDENAFGGKGNDLPDSLIDELIMAPAAKLSASRLF
jgi:hypothetical protein